MSKILFINSSPSFGGTEKWAIVIASMLQKKGHKIWFTCRYQNIRQRAIDHGLSAIQLPLKNDFDFWSVLKLRNFIVKNNIDAVIATKVREYWLGGCAAKFASVPFIIRLGIRRNLKKSVKNRLIYRYFMRAMIVNTLAIKENLLENNLIEPERIHVIYNGIDCPVYLPQTDRKNNIKNLVYIGFLSLRKNVRTIVQIFYKLQKRIDSDTVNLWFVGDGPERSKLQVQVNTLGIKNKVRFWGHRDDIPDILKQAHIMLVLSQSEGFPNAAMEAMSWGVPLIISNFYGVEEFVSHGITAFIVDPSDEDDIIDKLKILITDHETHHQMRINAYQHMKNNYSLARMTENVEHLLRSVLHG